jgi:hypothetical protein
MTGKWLTTAGVVALLASGIATPAIAEEPEVTIAAVGDIACAPDERAYNNGDGTPAGCRQRDVADAVRDINPSVFIPLGDNQHHNGTYQEYMDSYDKEFGDLKPITRPIPGNHEYNTPGGAGYFQYFGPAAHQQDKGNYSYRAGSWHILAINSTQCGPSRPCGPGSPLAKWIAAEVAANPAKCMMAVWHHPVWSAGSHGNNTPMVPVWNQLYSYGADIVLNGHDHGYQRTVPLGPASLTETGSVAAPVPTEGGMVQIIPATGGQNNFGIGGNQAVADAMATIGANSTQGVFGPLRMRLGDGRYSFDFVPVPGVSFTDSGQSACRQKTPPSDVPAKPAVTVTRSGDGAVTVTWNANRWSDRLPVTYTAQLVGRARSCTSTGTSCTITGLTNGTSYSVVVTASNDIADVPSEPVSFIPAAKPGRPGTPTATVVADQVTVAWPASTSTGGLPITYRVKAFPGGKTCTTQKTSCTLAMPVGSYTFTVVATNEVGESLGISTPKVSVAAPPAPAISGLSRAGDGRISVQVTPGPGAGAWGAATYVVTSSPGRKTCSTAGTSCVVRGLTNGTSYTFTAVMRTERLTSTTSAVSAPLIAARVPARTSAATVTKTGPDSVTVSWAASSYNGGLPITSYEVMIGNGPKVVCTTSGLTCNVTGLAPGSYWFTVVAINDAGRSANSSGSAVVKL